VPWAVYGTFSGFHLFMNPQGRALSPKTFDPLSCSMEELKGANAHTLARLRLALLVNGIDVNSRIGGFTSSTHEQSDVDHAIGAFREAIHMLRAENELPA
jgi:glutamate-1-semialdehyde 2,1-aminomutase